MGSASRTRFTSALSRACGPATNPVSWARLAISCCTKGVPPYSWREASGSRPSKAWPNMRPTKHSPSRSGSFTAIEARTRLYTDTNSTRWKNRMRTSAYGTPSPARSTRDGRARRDGLVKKPSAKWRSGSRIRFTTSAAHLAWSWERSGYCVTWAFRMTTSRSKRSEDTRDGPRRRDGRVPVSGKWPGAGWLNASAVALSIFVGAAHDHDSFDPRLRFGSSELRQTDGDL